MHILDKHLGKVVQGVGESGCEIILAESKGGRGQKGCSNSEPKNSFINPAAIWFSKWENFNGKWKWKDDRRFSKWETWWRHCRNNLNNQFWWTWSLVASLNQQRASPTSVLTVITVVQTSPCNILVRSGICIQGTLEGVVHMSELYLTYIRWYMRGTWKGVWVYNIETNLNIWQWGSLGIAVWVGVNHPQAK